MADSPRLATEPAADTPAPRGLAWFLDRTPPDGTPPPRTAGEWNRQAVAAFIAHRSPKETPMPDPKPAPEHPQDTHDELLLIALSAQTGKTLTSLYDLIEVDLDDHETMERVLAAVLPAARKLWFAELFGTPEEIDQREREAATETRDDTVDLCERARPGEHARRVRAQVAAEISEESLTSGWDPGGMQRAAQIARGGA